MFITSSLWKERLPLVPKTEISRITDVPNAAVCSLTRRANHPSTPMTFPFPRSDTTIMKTSFCPPVPKKAAHTATARVKVAIIRSMKNSTRSDTIFFITPPEWRLAPTSVGTLTTSARVATIRPMKRSPLAVTNGAIGNLSLSLLVPKKVPDTNSVWFAALRPKRKKSTRSDIPRENGK